MKTRKELLERSDFSNFRLFIPDNKRFELGVLLPSLLFTTKSFAEFFSNQSLHSRGRLLRRTKMTLYEAKTEREIRVYYLLAEHHAQGSSEGA